MHRRPVSFLIRSLTLRIEQGRSRGREQVERRKRNHSDALLAELDDGRGLLPGHGVGIDAPPWAADLR